MNMFTAMIYDGLHFSWKHCFKYWKHCREIKKFTKDIMNGSPTFDMLWQMAEFIKIAETVFFYKNDQKSSALYSARSYTSGQNGFRVTDESMRIRATVKLISEYQKVMLEIENMDSNAGKTTISFTNNDWETTPSYYDEMLIEQVIHCINKNIMKLFIDCYEKRLNSKVD